MNAADRMLKASEGPTLLPLCVASRGRSLKLNYRRQYCKQYSVCCHVTTPIVNC
jgi:hypothetical protein